MRAIKAAIHRYLAHHVTLMHVVAFAADHMHVVKA